MKEFFLQELKAKYIKMIKVYSNMKSKSKRFWNMNLICSRPLAYPCKSCIIIFGHLTISFDIGMKVWPTLVTKVDLSSYQSKAPPQKK
jgi:hypothetical protein